MRDKIVKVWSGLVFLFILRKVIKVIREVNRRNKLLDKLPHLPTKKGYEWRLDPVAGLVCGDRSRIESGEIDIPEYLEKNMLRDLTNVFNDEFKDEGLYMAHCFNRKLQRILPTGIAVLRDHHLVKEFCSSKNSGLVRKGMAYQISKPLIGNGILISGGSFWHHQRLVIEKAFTDNIMVNQFPAVVKTALELVDRINYLNGIKPGNINAIEELLKTTLDVLARVAFTYDIGSLTARDTRDAPLFHAFEVILDGLQERTKSGWLLATSGLPTSKNRRIKKALQKLRSVVDDIVRKRQITHGDASSQTRTRDLLDMMLDGNMERSLIVDNIQTIMFAGHDTTAAALTWGLYLLAKHPHLQVDIYKEYVDLFNGDVEMVKPKLLKQAVLLNCFVIEVLRFYPSAGFTKTVKEDLTLGKYTIPKGCDVFVNPYIIHRDEKYYEKANEFIPSRWKSYCEDTESLSLQAIIAKISMEQAFMPFSLGRRNCVGRKLALLEIRVILLYLLHNYEIKLPAKQPEGFSEIPYVGLTNYPKALTVKFIPRTKPTNNS